MSLVMFDSVDVGTVPGFANAPNYAVAGYVGGFWPTFSPLVQRFPRAHHLSIAVHPSEDADCLDCERGDASPADAPAWVRRQIRRGVWRPVVYSSVSEMPEVIRLLTEAGISRSDYRVWSAHYTWRPHIEPGSDATQWTEQAYSRNLDQSECSDQFFAGRGTVHHRNGPRYDWFDVGPFALNGRDLNERAVVEQYDRLRQHPLLNRRKLVLVRHELRDLANRVWTVAHAQPRDDGHPSWNQYHRGWRFQQLAHRAQGARFA